MMSPLNLTREDLLVPASGGDLLLKSSLGQTLDKLSQPPEGSSSYRFLPGTFVESREGVVDEKAPV